MNTVAAKREAGEKVWWLTGATKYKSNHDGDFSPTSVMSRHMFGWDKAKQCFVFENDFGAIVRKSRQTMPMPVELAEAFLLRCREPEFYGRMLAAHGGLDEMVEETIRYGDYALEVKRTRDTSTALRLHQPNLLLTLRSKEPIVGFVLFGEMRVKLGVAVTALSEEVIKQHLRA